LRGGEAAAHISLAWALLLWRGDLINIRKEVSAVSVQR
jgi:hypothetical protein